MLGIERRVVFRKIGVARVAEDAFDKIQIADQPTGHEKAHFHAFLGRDPGHFGADHGTEQQGNKTLRRFRQR